MILAHLASGRHAAGTAAKQCMNVEVKGQG
jgi:hypothetical protein